MSKENSNDFSDGRVIVTNVGEEKKRSGRGWCFPWCFQGNTGIPTISKYGLGIVLILCVTVIWVASSEWIQFIFGALEFNKPFFLTYFNTSGFALWNLGYLCLPKWRESPWEDLEDPQEVTVQGPPFEHCIAGTTESVELEEESRGEGSQDSLRSRKEGERGKEKRDQTHERVGEKVPRKSSHLPFYRQRHCARGNSTEHSFSPTRRVPLLTLRCNTEGIRTRMSTPPFPLPLLCSDEKEKEVHGCHPYLSSTPVFFASSLPSTVDCTVSSPVKERESVAKGSVEASSSSSSCSSIISPPSDIVTVRKYSKRRIWKVAAIFCPFWCLANYLFNLSLAYTSVSSNTIMSAMGTVWTVVLSRVLLRASLGPLKLAGVLICITGSITVGMSSSSENRSTTLGNVIALLSSFFYAIYTFVLRWWLPDDECYSMGQVFGAVGVINLVLMWPAFFFLDWVGLEPFALPSIQQFLPLVVNALIGTNLSDVLWARSVILTSPVVATMGLSLTTPLSMVVDKVLYGSSYLFSYVFGAVLVVIGFIVANVHV